MTLSPADREALAALPFDEEVYRAALDVPALAGETGWTTLERRGARPTFDVNGIWGGFSGEGSKTIIPGRASAKVTCRLVADQDPERDLRASCGTMSWRSPRRASASRSSTRAGVARP